MLKVFAENRNQCTDTTLLRPVAYSSRRKWLPQVITKYCQIIYV
jgi:hypothetical protein